MADNIKDLFGSDSDDSDNEGPAASAVPQQKEYNVDELFASSDEDSDDEPAPKKKAPASRLKKKAEKQPTRKEKEARPKKRPRAEKQPKGKGPASAGGPAGGPAGGGAEGEYDSGEEVVADDADKAFIDSDDDLDDIKKEYDAERQDFRDEAPDGSYDGSESPEERKQQSGGSEKIDAKSANAIDKAILAARKKRSKDMAETDKQVVVTSLLEKMEEAWRLDMDCLGSAPSRPAVHKLAMLDAVVKMLRQRGLHETLLDMNILEMIRNWLLPWPMEDSEGVDLPLAKRTLPNLSLRSSLYGLLAQMPIRPEHLKNSERGGDGGDRPGLGKVALLLWKHPGETAEHKQKLRKLVEEWNRHIFGKTKDFKQLPSTLRESGKAAERRRLAGPGQGGQGGAADIAGVSTLDELESNRLRGGEESDRVVLPYRVGFDFKVRPVAQSVEALKRGKMQEKMKNLAAQVKDQKRKIATGSQRGEAPKFRVDL